MKVHLLATVRKEELLPASTMVFQTLRVGFPTAEIHVTYNNCSLEHEKVLDECVKKVGATRTVLESKIIHHDWITELLLVETEPFFLCDTDMAFWKPAVEDWPLGDAPLAGRFVPQFFDKFTNCITRSRLHTSLLYLNPTRIKEEVSKYFAQFPETPFNPRPNLIDPIFQPVREGVKVRNYFHDTCSLLYHALGGQRFTPEQLDGYDHLQFGTISDLVAPHYPGHDLRMWAFMVFDNPNLLKGQWREDDKFYAQAAV